MSETTEAEYETSDRGFRHYPEIETDYGHTVKIYESSAAMQPCIWMRVDGAGNGCGDEEVRLSVHLTDEEAGKIVDSIQACREGHYQTRHVSAMAMEEQIGQLRDALSKIANHAIENPGELAWETLNAVPASDRPRQQGPGGRVG